MKISVGHIILAHLRTLADSSSGKTSIADIFLFFGIPLVVSVASVFVDIKIGKDFYNLSITFFGIFIALLLNIQVAVFSVFQRNWNKPSDLILDSLQKEKIEQKRLLLKELNVNVSYLIVLSCIYLAIYIVLFSIDMENIYIKALTVLLYTHFLLTLMMTVKRTYALFQGEYELG